MMRDRHPPFATLVFPELILKLFVCKLLLNGEASLNDGPVSS